MSTLPTPDDIRHLAIKAGISMEEACRRAGIAGNTFRRWAANQHSPRLATVQALQNVLQEAIRERRGDVGATIMGAPPT